MLRSLRKQSLKFDKKRGVKGQSKTLRKHGQTTKLALRPSTT